MSEGHRQLLSELIRAMSRNRVHGFVLVGDGAGGFRSQVGVVRTPLLGPDHAPFVIVRMPDGKRRLVDVPAGQRGLLDDWLEEAARG